MINVTNKDELYHMESYTEIDSSKEKVPFNSSNKLATMEHTRPDSIMHFKFLSKPHMLKNLKIRLKHKFTIMNYTT